MSVRARVFLSCGQSKQSGERDIAHRIEERLRKLGYDPYIAVEEQTLKGVKENIFRQLESAEYFVFIDFKREKLRDSEEYRGSLFSHQELAVAAFRDKEVIAFREQGVELSGVARYIQANAKPFSDREHLPALVADEFQCREWTPGWRSELTMRADAPTNSDAKRVARDAYNNVNTFMARFFHVTVRNLHRDRPAINCYAYLEDVRDADTDHRIPVRTIEHKWKGYTLPNALIAPNSIRSFDAFWVPHNNPSRVTFNVFTDSTAVVAAIPKPGTYYFAYRVIAENFPSVKARFRVLVADRLEDTGIERVQD